MTRLVGPEKEEDNTRGEYEEEEMVEVEDDSDSSSDDEQSPAQIQRSGNTRGESFEETPVQSLDIMTKITRIVQALHGKSLIGPRSLVSGPLERKKHEGGWNLAKPITSQAHLKPEGTL
jgi:hypothetical protein